MNRSSYLKLLSVSVMICLTQLSCKKLVNVAPPVTSLTNEAVFSNDATAITTLNGIYTKMALSGSIITGTSSIPLYAGLSADEFTVSSLLSSTDVKPFFYRNALFAGTGAGTGGPISAGDSAWGPLYTYIYGCNSALEGLNISNTLTPVIKQQLIGEAEFLRAFCYFYLVNLYGDVPLAVSSDYKVNSTLSRVPKDQVYLQIIKDLQDAQSKLSNTFLDQTLLTVTTEKVRPTSWAATALLSRVYLYKGDYANALQQSTAIISSGRFSLPALNNVFQKNSPEAIWQLQPVTTGWNTEEGRMFLLLATGPNTGTQPVSLSSMLMGSFEPTDQRKTIGNWVNSINVSGTTYYYPYKYKVNNTVNSAITSPAAMSEYLMMFRLGEQYLIRAEANAQLNNISNAQADLNVIRNRAGLLATSASTQSALLTAILHERQVELFSEWGHRWLDLKRTDNVDAVMSFVTPLKGGIWNTNQQLYPLPLTEIQYDSNLSQNPGY